MSINIQNNNQATIVVNNSENLNLNIVNGSKSSTYLEINKGNNNTISVFNEAKENSDYSFIIISFIFFLVYLFFYIFKKKTNNYTLKKEPEENEFHKIKEELTFIISNKINSENIKNRIYSIINDFEETYNKNIEMINKLKYNEKSLKKLQIENNNIIYKLKDILNKLEIDDTKFDVSNLDEILRYVNLVEETRKN
jgi:hypothetical protein